MNWNPFRKDKKEDETLESFLSDVKVPKIIPYSELDEKLRAKIDALRMAFPHLNNWGYYSSGKIKDVFVAEPRFEGVEGSQIRLAVKMDKTVKEIMDSDPSGAMLQHYEKDYRSRREASIGVQAYGIDGLSVPVESKELGNVGLPGSYAYVEQFFPSVSLQQLLEQKGTLPFKPALDIATNMTDMVTRFNKKTDLLHRDLKPSNILIGLEDRLGKVYVTDTSAAAKPWETIESFTHSCPGRETFDPWNCSQRTGLAASYTEPSEVYALAKMFGMMLLGKDFLPFDPYSKEPPNIEEYESQLKEATSKLTGKGKRARKLISNGLTINSLYRTPSLELLGEQLRSISRPPLVSKFLKNWKRNTAIALVGSLGFMSAGAFATKNYIANVKATQQRLAEEQRTIYVGADWDGNNSIQPSALFELKPQIYSEGQFYPSRNNIIVAKPGSVLTVGAEILEKPISEKIRRLPYMHYPLTVRIEGTTNIPSESFYRDGRDPRSVNSGWGYAMMRSSQKSACLNIPKDFPEGNYTIIVDCFSPIKANKLIDPREAIIKINGNNALAEERIPLIIGKQSKIPRISSIKTSTFESEMKLGSFIQTNGTYLFQEHYESPYQHCFQIPEIGYKGTNSFNQISFPGGTNYLPGRYTLLVDVRDGDKTLLSTSYPIEYGTNQNSYGFSSWMLVTPSKDFYDKVAEYRSRQSK